MEYASAAGRVLDVARSYAAQFGVVESAKHSALPVLEPDGTQSWVPQVVVAGRLVFLRVTVRPDGTAEVSEFASPKPQQLVAEALP